MSYIINLLEALIVSYGLVELCNINKKNAFFVLNTVITFAVVQIFDCIDQNFMLLSIVSIILWYIEVMMFTKKKIIYNFLFVVFIELLCSLCAFLPILTLYKYSRILAGFFAKLIQFLLHMNLFNLKENMITSKTSIGLQL